MVTGKCNFADGCKRALLFWIQLFPKLKLIFCVWYFLILLLLCLKKFSVGIFYNIKFYHRRCYWRKRRDVEIFVSRSRDLEKWKILMLHRWRFMSFERIQKWGKPYQAWKSPYDVLVIFTRSLCKWLLKERNRNTSDCLKLYSFFEVRKKYLLVIWWVEYFANVPTYWKIILGC